MANMALSALATRLRVGGNQAAIATAIGGGMVATDVAALGEVIGALSLRNDTAFEALGLATTPANASTMLTPG